MGCELPLGSESTRPVPLLVTQAAMSPKSQPVAQLSTVVPRFSTARWVLGFLLAHFVVAPPRLTDYQYQARRCRPLRAQR